MHYNIYDIKEWLPVNIFYTEIWFARSSHDINEKIFIFEKKSMMYTYSETTWSSWVNIKKSNEIWKRCSI